MQITCVIMLPKLELKLLNKGGKKLTFLNLEHVTNER